jgi:hypothetical protein
MKKTLLIFALVFASIISMQAQMWLGGNINTQLNKEVKTFSIAPDVGYCIPNTPFSIACAVEYEGTIQKDEAYSHSLTVSPYFRYEICEIEERFSLFVDLISDIEALDFSFFDIGLAPGISFNLTEHWSAEFSYGFLGYQQEQVPGDRVDRNFVLNFSTATGLFGIYYSF